MPHAPPNLLCVSVLVLICDKRSETLRWVARGPLAVHRGALPVWLTGHGSEVDETDTQRTQVDVDLRAFAFLFVPCGVDDTQLPPSAPSHGTMVISSYYYNTKDLPEFYAHRSTHRQDPIAPSPTSQIESQKKVITSNSLWACSAVHAGGSGILRACAASNGPGLPQMPGRDGTTKM